MKKVFNNNRPARPDLMASDVALTNTLTIHAFGSKYRIQL